MNQSPEAHARPVVDCYYCSVVGLSVCHMSSWSIPLTLQPRHARHQPARAREALHDALELLGIVERTANQTVCNDRYCASSRVLALLECKATIARGPAMRRLQEERKPSAIQPPIHRSARERREGGRYNTYRKVFHVMHRVQHE